MKELIEHLRDEMLIAQVIYEFNINRFRRSCSKYFAKDQVWLNARNLNIARFAIKLNDRHVDFFSIKRVFDKNSLIIELELFAFMKIHSMFHVILLSHIVTNSLSSQIFESRESFIVENDERVWYVNSILNFKRDKRYNSSLLKYYFDWKDHFSIWELFYVLNNCRRAARYWSCNDDVRLIEALFWMSLVRMTCETWRKKKSKTLLDLFVLSFLND